MPRSDDSRNQTVSLLIFFLITCKVFITFIINNINLCFYKIKFKPDMASSVTYKSRNFVESNY